MLTNRWRKQNADLLQVNKIYTQYEYIINIYSLYAQVYNWPGQRARNCGNNPYRPGFHSQLHTRPALQIWGTVGTWWSTTSQCCFCGSWRASTSCRRPCGGSWSCTSSRSCPPTSSGCPWRRQVMLFCLQARPSQASAPAGAPGHSDLRSPHLRAPLRCVLSQERFLKLQVGPRIPRVSSQKPVHLCSFPLWCYLTSPGCTPVCTQNVYLNTHGCFLYIKAQPAFAQLRGTESVKLPKNI